MSFFTNEENNNVKKTVLQSIPTRKVELFENSENKIVGILKEELMEELLSYADVYDKLPCEYKQKALKGEPFEIVITNKEYISFYKK